MKSFGDEERGILLRPIGYFKGGQKEKYMAPRQAEGAGEGQPGVIMLSGGSNFEQALEGLEGFGRIWVIYQFDRNTSWKAKVSTPRGGPKRGVFATRSPHRPNPIGLSCVRLLGIEGKNLFIGSSDLLDGTPILDIKPYLNYSDAFPDTLQGWLEDVEPINTPFEVVWTPLAKEQLAFIGDACGIDLESAVSSRLRSRPFPFRNHRIIKLSEDQYELAVKTWRFKYTIKGNSATILSIASGYDRETLSGLKASRWNDVPLHLEFIKRFDSAC